jgi:anti-sigma B factor antagonist
VVPSRTERNTLHPVPSAFGLSTRDLDGGAGTAIAVEGELDLATAPDLERTLDDVLSADNRVIVDLSLTTFMDSSALNVLLGAAKRLGAEAAPRPDDRPPDEGRARNRDRRLTIVCLNQDVLRIFELAGLDSAFAIFPTLEQALAHVKEREACTS